MDTCARYLLNNAKYLKYDDYLKAGCPIATGVIEGACRHLIQDKIESLGLDGAWGVLRLFYPWFLYASVAIGMSIRSFI